MPIEKLTLSIDQLSELLGIDPRRFIGIQVNRQAKTIWILMEPDDADQRDVQAARG